VSPDWGWRELIGPELVKTEAEGVARRFFSRMPRGGYPPPWPSFPSRARLERSGVGRGRRTPPTSGGARASKGEERVLRLEEEARLSFAFGFFKRRPLSIQLSRADGRRRSVRPSPGDEKTRLSALIEGRSREIEFPGRSTLKEVEKLEGGKPRDFKEPVSDGFFGR
jgi:hypothetical protein